MLIRHLQQNALILSQHVLLDADFLAVLHLETEKANADQFPKSNRTVRPLTLSP